MVGTAVVESALFGNDPVFIVIWRSRSDVSSGVIACVVAASAVSIKNIFLIGE